jgi:hypothetical protein
MARPRRTEAHVEEHLIDLPLDSLDHPNHVARSGPDRHRVGDTSDAAVTDELGFEQKGVAPIALS